MNISEKHNGNIFNVKYIIIAIVVSLLNSFYYDNFAIMLFLTVIQSLVLIKCLMLGQDVKYLCYYIIFLSTSLESATFVGTDVFYGFKAFRIAGVNLGAIFILLPLIKLVLTGKLQHPFRSKGFIGKFIKGVYIITPIAFIMGLFNLLINDNNIQESITNIGMFVDASYIFLFVAAEAIVIYTIIKLNINRIDEIKQCLLAIVISLSINLVTSLLFQNYGNRGGLDSLQVSNIIMLLFCTILLPFYSDYKKHEKIILAIITGTIFLLGITYNTNGKMLIVAMIIPILILTIQLRKKMYMISWFTFMGILFIVYFTVNIIIPRLSSNNFLLSTKLDQATSMFLFGNGWLENMPSSPKIRISQFLNITIEYFKKPWFFLEGKGYLGTIKDHLSLFTDVDEFTYSKWQIENGLYYVLHETLNTLYLTNGLIGLIFFFWMFKIIATKIHKSPWIMIGGIWFVFFYAYSITISIIGITSLIIGLMDLDIERNDFQKTNNQSILQKN
ncbi:hypothetical protein [Cohnella laeviribosi]|uniref:hypothetical protein n=1 Tax=Cohnella laeviribosi TaxID=380174 RepID=UPI003D1A39DE